MPQAAGQVKTLIFLVKIKFFPIYANIFCDAGQMPILRYFEACREIENESEVSIFCLNQYFEADFLWNFHPCICLGAH